MKRAPTLTLSLAFCATTSLAHAQLVPMVSQPTEQPALTAMEPAAGPAQPPLQRMAAQTQPEITLQPMATASESLVTLQPMAGPAPTSATLKAMLNPVPDSDTTVTPMLRPSATEVMKGRSNPRISSPVPYLAPLPPKLQVTPTTPKSSTSTIRLPKQLRNVLPTLPTLPHLFGPSKPAPIGAEPKPVFTDADLSPNPNVPTVERPDSELIMADVVLNGIQRKTVIELYQDDAQTLWLPFTPMMQLLEMPVTANPAAGVAQGWYQTVTNTVVINMDPTQKGGGKATIGKTSYPTDKAIEKHIADLYLTPAAFKKWFDIDINLNYADLRLVITTPKPLPGDLHAERLANWEKTEKTLRREPIPSDTLIPGYSDFSLPVLRLGANTNINRPAGGSVAESTGLTIQAENDLLGATSNLSLAFAQHLGTTNPGGESNGLTGGSWLVQKQSKEADLLGPLHARYFGLGDITTNALPLTGIASQGRGVRVNNTPQGAVNNPDQYILTGPAPINWDVEVYQNATLVAYTRIDTSGRYTFNALPLRAGRNVFRLVFYGPNGEREERQDTLFLADNIPDQGQVQYDTAVFQPNKALIPGLPNQPSGSAITAQTQFTAGLARNWAATVGAFKTSGTPSTNTDIKPEEDGVTTGLRGAFGNTYFTADLFGGRTGNAAQSTLRMPLTNDIDLRLSQSRNFDFDPANRDELDTSEAELALPFNVGKAAFDTTYGYARTTYQTQPTLQEYTQRTSVGYNGLNATNKLTYTVQQNSENRMTGELESAIHVLQTSVRVGLTYQPTAEDPLQTLTLNSQLPLARDRTLNLTYTQQLAQTKTAGLAGSMYWKAGPWALGVQAQAETTGNLSAGLNLTTAMVPQGRINDLQNAKWKQTSPNATIGQGQAAVRVYADANMNGRFDPGEPVIPNVAVNNRQRGSTQTTNSSGMATFSDLAPNILTRLDIDQTTLPDIYLKPVSETLNVQAHTGDNGILNYAVRLYGEISGQALVAEHPVQDLTIKITNAEGQKLDTAITEHDGYFTFGALPMGTYTLTVSSSIVTMAPAQVTLTAQKRIVTNNLTVIPNP